MFVGPRIGRAICKKNPYRLPNENLKGTPSRPAGILHFYICGVREKEPPNRF